MSVALVQQSASVGNFSGTNSAATGVFPTSGVATAGNLLVLPWGHQQYDGHSVAQAATGYSSAGAANQGANHAAAGILYKLAAGGESAATVTNTTAGTSGNSYGTATLAEFSGLDGTAPYVSADSATNSGVGTSASLSSSNPLSESSGLAVAVYAANTTMTGATDPPTGWTDLITLAAGGNLVVACYLIFSSSAQLNPALGAFTSAEWAATISIFKAATAASTAKLLSQLSNQGGF
jgi:hypothetical protein